MEYQIGDKVVHPFHGAGIITSIEEKECFGETHLYYLLILAHSKLELNIPVDSADTIGLRPIMRPEDAEAVFERLRTHCETETLNWNKKHRENMDKLRSGDIFDAADVYKYLRLRETKRNLSTGEKKLLTNSKNAIFSEIMLATGLSEEELTEKVDQIFEGLKQAESQKQKE